MSLFAAVAQRNLALVQELINAGADVNQADPIGDTPLMNASENGLIEIAKVLIAAGADINKRDVYGFTALIYASKYGHLSTVQLLVSKGADINMHEVHGNTALMFVCFVGFLSIVQFLVSKGADINVVNDVGITALDIATRLGHTEIINFLTKVKNRGYLQDFQRVSRTARRTVRSRQGQLETLTPLDPDVSRLIAQMSLNSFGKKKRMSHGLNGEIRYLRSL